MVLKVTIKIKVPALHNKIKGYNDNSTHSKIYYARTVNLTAN